jgi:type IV pilus assembly protein PilB
LSSDGYIISCWNCLGEYDALGAVWCSDDSRSPTKLCPFCLRCFCDASEEFKKIFWREAPQRLLEELQMLHKSNERLGDILVRQHRITIPQLLEVLQEQRRTGKRLGELLVDHSLVKQDDIDSALKLQGAHSLADTQGVAYAAKPVWEQSTPDAIIQYILTLAARRGASDVHIEPKEDNISVKYRIDGFFFRVDPIPKQFQTIVTQKLFDLFRLDPGLEARPQTSRTSGRIADTEFDLVAQTLPTPYGVSATIKLINRATFIKDFSTLGLEIEDRVHIMESLRTTFGLIVVSSPTFNGAGTTGYTIMHFLVHSQRDVISLEAPIHWRMEGARQVEVAQTNGGLQMEQALRSAMLVRPEVLIVSSVPDPTTALLATQLATSLLVVMILPAQSAGQAIANLLALGVPAGLLASNLLTVTCQRLIRKICTICRQPVGPPAPQTLALHGIDPSEAAGLKFFKGKGCPTCNKIGFRGRHAIFEIMAGVPELRGAIANGMSAAEIETVAMGAGMVPLRRRALDLVSAGVTTFDEFTRLRL